ncbi:MAG: ArsR family transcriptional regulator [Verrucomicrobia bacterium]|nr:ArsR family transcriptional regulator [Verrucomicrobiota bacterium]
MLGFLARLSRNRPPVGPDYRVFTQDFDKTVNAADLDSVFESASGYFALLAEPMRLKILHAICDRERTVGDIVTATGASPSAS